LHRLPPHVCQLPIQVCHQKQLSLQIARRRQRKNYCEKLHFKRFAIRKMSLKITQGHQKWNCATYAEWSCTLFARYYNFLSYATCYLRQSFSTFLLQYGITPDSPHRRAMTPLLRANGCARQCEDWTRPLFKGVGCKSPSLSTHWASRVPSNTPASLPFKRHLNRFSRFCRGSRPGHHRDTQKDLATTSACRDAG